MRLIPCSSLLCSSLLCSSLLCSSLLRSLLLLLTAILFTAALPSVHADYYDEDAKPIKLVEQCGGPMREELISDATHGSLYSVTHDADLDNLFDRPIGIQFFLEYGDHCVHTTGIGRPAKDQAEQDKTTSANRLSNPAWIAQWKNGEPVLTLEYKGIFLAIIRDNDHTNGCGKDGSKSSSNSGCNTPPKIIVANPAAPHWCDDKVAVRMGSAIEKEDDNSSRAAGKASNKPALYMTAFENPTKTLFEFYVLQNGQCHQANNAIYSTSCMGCVAPDWYRLNDGHWRFAANYDESCIQLYYSNHPPYVDIRLEQQDDQVAVTLTPAMSHTVVSRYGRFGINTWAPESTWYIELHELIEGVPHRLEEGGTLFCHPSLTFAEDGDDLLVKQAGRRVPLPTTVDLEAIADCPHPDAFYTAARDYHQFPLVDPKDVVFRYRRPAGLKPEEKGTWSIDSVKPYVGEKLGRFGMSHWQMKDSFYRIELYDIEAEPKLLEKATREFCWQKLEFEVDKKSKHNDLLIHEKKRRLLPPSGQFDLGDIAQCPPKFKYNQANEPYTYYSVTYRYRRQQNIGTWSVENVEKHQANSPKK